MKPATDTIRVLIRRGDAHSGQICVYRAPRRENQTVLDVVTWIQRELAPDLAYRFSCRVGMCGTCAMMVGGAPRWTCRTHVKTVLRRGQLELAPLRSLPIIKDLACDMSEFFAKWRRAEGRFHSSPERSGRAQPPVKILPSTPARREADAAIECINCAVCYSACDVVAWNRDYLGPAALNRAWSLQNDARDSAHARRLRAVSAGGGCQHCHSQHSCESFCPVGLSPARSIAGLKRALARGALGIRPHSPPHA
ncbi:MAG: 2Fe-2S iron-sulfur cluster-binding protein [Gammaproteobacteria bacterium]|nr:2Fe-2S iron-sulfur cluster-binding protein [Gammaproteobacteria bacterium]